MPRHLLISCAVLIIGLLGRTVIAPFYEDRIGQYLSPALGVGLVSLVVLFMRRKQWTWRYAFWIAFSSAIINVAFFPTREFYGALTPYAAVFSAIEIAGGSALFLSMTLSPATKAWFRVQPGANNAFKQSPHQGGV
ncbi:hypothetical protein [Xanthomonas tesorieronis]|uniref:hypothetical protein n=1 Tax=Xanthomonas tesorieronis TaxID=3160839 RepID=UPI003511AF25